MFRNSIILMLVLLLCIGCTQEQEVTIISDFQIKIESGSYQIPVKVKTQNLSSGAYRYKWLFPGAEIEKSSAQNPVIIYTKPGEYEITLMAFDNNDKAYTKTQKIVVYPKLTSLFTYDSIIDSAAPVALKLQNKSIGATNCFWEFESGEPKFSKEKNPTVIFKEKGNHIIRLHSINNKDTVSFQREVVVTPKLSANFKWQSDFKNNYEAPVTLQVVNTTIGAKQYEWFVKGATTERSTKVNPSFLFEKEGVYTIELKAKNTKEEQVINKTITITAQDNLIDFYDLKFGINVNKKQGMFFSSRLANVLTQQEINQENGKMIEFAFLGLSNTFDENRFLSPSEVGNYVFKKIPDATETIIINSQEYTETPMTDSYFDQIKNGNQFQQINLTTTNASSLSFSSSKLPRIILFQTQDGRKGAIKIKEFIDLGVNSYILADVKLQKFTIQ